MEGKRAPGLPWLAAGLAVVIPLAGGWVLLRAFGDGGRQSVEIRPITPDELAGEAPLILAWEGAGPPYRAVLRRAGDGAVWDSGEIGRPWVALPEEARRRLEPGDYRWSVEGRDRLGRAVRSREFALRVLAPADPSRPSPA